MRGPRNRTRPSRRAQASQQLHNNEQHTNPTVEDLIDLNSYHNIASVPVKPLINDRVTSSHMPSNNISAIQPLSVSDSPLPTSTSSTFTVDMSSRTQLIPQTGMGPENSVRVRNGWLASRQHKDTEASDDNQKSGPIIKQSNTKLQCTML